MKEEIIDLVSSVLGVDKNTLNENTNFVRDLDVESLDLIDLVAAFEEKYNIDILDQDIKNLQTIKDIVDYIEKNHV